MEFHKPLGRALKYTVLKRLAERRAGYAIESANTGLPAAFVIGCGRSGTTILGEVLDQHPAVYYFFEPYHLWATIDPISDVTNLYGVGACKFIMDQDDCTAESRRRFSLLFQEPGMRAGAELVVEKTPFNACRIGYLESIKPQSRFIHIVRDGIDVARSISRLSTDDSYKIAGKPGRSRWWGRNECKWDALSTDGMDAGYFPDEVSQLRDYQAKGAYEWLVSLAEVDRWRDHLGDRLLEITYDELTATPRRTMAEICDFLGISKQQAWLEECVRKIDQTRHNGGETLVLPPGMCEEFNQRQISYGFKGRAKPTRESATQSRPAYHVAPFQGVQAYPA
jgi:hypothetical protein